MHKNAICFPCSSIDIIVQSSVLSAILGELPAHSGKIHVGGKLAYTSQIPWLFSDTVRNNILFGEEFNLHRYQKVVKACALGKVNCCMFSLAFTDFKVVVLLVAENESQFAQLQVIDLLSFFGSFQLVYQLF